MIEMDLKEKCLRDTERQLNFCRDMIEKLVIDFHKNKVKTPFYSWDFIANKTQMKNDIRRLRRELKDLYDMLERK